jgi:hypothetical protein
MSPNTPCGPAAGDTPAVSNAGGDAPTGTNTGVEPAVGDGAAPAPLTARRHSGYGIASLVIAVLSGGAIAGLVGGIIYVGTTTPGGLKADDPRAYQIGMGIALAAMGHFVGLVLGLAGLFQRRRKVTAIVGTVLNGFVLLVLAWVLLSSAAKQGGAPDGAPSEPAGIVDTGSVGRDAGQVSYGPQGGSAARHLSRPLASGRVRSDRDGHGSSQAIACAA